MNEYKFDANWFHQKFFTDPLLKNFHISELHYALEDLIIVRRTMKFDSNFNRGIVLELNEINENSLTVGNLITSPDLTDTILKFKRLRLAYYNYDLKEIKYYDIPNVIDCIGTREIAILFFECNIKKILKDVKEDNFIIIYWY